ncbi:MAG TPA: hypothetical protein VGF61_13300 [Candidatus Acidoferrum sp.]|jgi:hypothetical protein
MKLALNRFFFLLCICLAAAQTAHANAWTQPAGGSQIIFNLSYFQTSHQYDNFGHVVPNPNGAYFRQFLLNPYMEFGLSDRTTLVVNAYIPFLAYHDAFTRQQSTGWGDTEIGIRRRITSLESRFVFSAQGTVLFPAYSPDREPPPGNHNVDVEARVLLGHGTQFSEKRNFFWDLEAAYRYRNGPPADQVRIDATVGIEPVRRILLLQQFFVIKSLQNGAPLTAGTNPNAQSDFDLYKLQSSLVVALNKKNRVQVGWVDTVGGRNTGRGSSLLLSLWRNF